MSEVQTQNDITISSKAIKEIHKIMEENNFTPDVGLRVGVKGGGCSGLTYSMGFDPESRDGDTIIEQDDIKLYVDGKSLFYLMGTELDFTSGLNGKGFVFNNPNAKKTCGCGESFGV
jgi:iron-sulfur cluster assembly protein